MASFHFMGIKMATDGVLRGLGIMCPFLAANMVTQNPPPLGCLNLRAAFRHCICLTVVPVIEFANS